MANLDEIQAKARCFQGRWMIGLESPTIEIAEADFNEQRIKMQGYHDFGVALQDPTVCRV